jgi:hypothetical protein
MLDKHVNVLPLNFLTRATLLRLNLLSSIMVT